MSDRTPRERVLLSGLDDWVSLAEVVTHVRSGTPTASDDAVRAATVSLISELVHEGLLQAGDLSPRFVAWSTSADATMEFIEKEWRIPPGHLDHARGWWFENTPAGDDAARALVASGKGR